MSDDRAERQGRFFQSRGPKIKIARGIEMTNEALVELIQQRFPDLVDWRYFLSPSVRVNEERDTIVLTKTHAYYEQDRYEFPSADATYWHGLGDWRRVGEGAPVPMMYVPQDMIRLPDGSPRCGYLVGEKQCGMVLNHEGQHGEVIPLA